jgi:hypothetical protein
MKAEGQLLPEQGHIPSVRADTPLSPATHVVFTRDHDVIREWAKKRQAVPATGEATASGPATVDVNDGGAGVRFNFPGTGSYRPISWDEWFGNFDTYECAFVFDNDIAAPNSSRYRIVKAADWKDLLS